MILAINMKNIPVHQLKERASTGLEIRRFMAGDTPETDETLSAHRDDHYLFFVVESGMASLMIDFHKISFQENYLYYILPGQVHHRIRNEMAGGWFIAVDTLLVPPDYRKIFENRFLLQQPYLLNNIQMRHCQGVLSLMQEKYSEDDKEHFYLPVVHSLLQAFIGVVAGCYVRLSDSRFRLSRLMELSQQFKLLLVANLHKEKSPSVYASMLNVSETYLNEALKKVTGFPVSYWILNEVMLEAKRLLYYSEQNVKQIAHTLGYDDHAYFSRLFKKAEGCSPLSFRTSYRK